nr:uncharacterized protein LOC124220050 [Neodiprion pinetum]
MGRKKEDHDCRLNFYGSAKAMEAAAGVELVNHSSILKEAGLQVRAIIGDEDSSMIAAVRADNPTQEFHKLCDKNHLTKNFGTALWKMQSSYKELARQGVSPHIKKCFSYAVSQNKGKSEQLALNLKQIPDHLFSRHENCAASSQGNESFNNVVAHKAHKNKCLSTSAACDIRVASAVCVKNDGDASILNIQKNKKSNIIDEHETIVVYFDIETTGFAANAHILQIAAICDTEVFNVYIHTKTIISASASAVTKLHHDHGKNLFHDKKKI